MRTPTTLLAAFLLAIPATAQAAPDPAAAVTAAMRAETGVTAAALAAGQREVQVQFIRRAAGWAFGTSLVTAPRTEHAAPQARVFVARLGGAGWQVAFDGAPAFPALTAAAPAAVVSAPEQAVFAANARNAATTSANTGLALPYPTGVAWRMIGGPHGWSGQPRPWSSVDLNGGDKRVLAAQEGVAYWPCRNGGHIRIIHPNGWTTEYYHLRNEIKPQGQPVKLGDYLGDTSTRIPCGGSAGSDHVHFAIKKGSAWQALQGNTIGGWTCHEGSRAYSGYVQRGSSRVNVGGSVVNHGPS